MCETPQAGPPLAADGGNSPPPRASQGVCVLAAAVFSLPCRFGGAVSVTIPRLERHLVPRGRQADRGATSSETAAGTFPWRPAGTTSVSSSGPESCCIRRTRGRLRDISCTLTLTRLDRGHPSAAAPHHHPLLVVSVFVSMVSQSLRSRWFLVSSGRHQQVVPDAVSHLCSRQHTSSTFTANEDPETLDSCFISSLRGHGAPGTD